MDVKDLNLQVPVDELAHYGVLGMKWGVIRSDAQLAASAHRKEQALQNKATRQKIKLDVRERAAKVKADEAKTKALQADAKKKQNEAKRVAQEPKRAEKAARRKEKEDKRRFDVQQKQKMEEQKVKAKMATKSNNDQTPTNFKSSDFKRMSDEDLRQVVNRMNLEKQYQQLNPKQPSTIKKVLGAVGTTAVTTKAVVDMMGGTQAVYSSLTGKKQSSKYKPAKDMTVEEMESVIRKSNVVNQYNKLRKDSTPADPTAAGLDAALNLASMLAKKKKEK